jgi:hypothetical protein
MFAPQMSNDQQPPTPRLNGERALIAYEAMQSYFYAGDGSSLYRERAGARAGRSYAHLWPYTQALWATLDLAGLSSSELPDFDPEGATRERLVALERYWDARADPPAYLSGVPSRWKRRADKYYDDNAWIGLALVAHHRQSGDESSLRRAEELFAFALSGWDSDQRHSCPGGVYWVQQGIGMGRADHSRNTVSNAPNAELGLQLQELTGNRAFAGRQPTGNATLAGQEATGNPAFAGQEGVIGAWDMYAWVNRTLDASADTVAAGTGLFYDHLKANGQIERTFWSYNQGTMIGANVLLHRLAGDADPRLAGDAGSILVGGSDSSYLGRAEAIARKALAHYRDRYFEQPEPFNAIFFRNLLALSAATDDLSLRQSILETISTYADEAWQTTRSEEDLFPASGPTLLKHGAMVQIFAMLARDPASYEELL